VVIHQNGGPVRLYLGQGADRGASWIGLRLLDPVGRPAVGASAHLRSRPSPLATVRLGGSYASTSDDRLIFGLGADRGPQEVRVRWPDGTLEDFGPLPVAAYATLRPGEGRPVARGARSVDEGGAP
jgi:enediyne biosynthesis protein E4